MRIFLGVHKFTPIAALMGDMGWSSSVFRRKVNFVRFWNRLTCMTDKRIPKIVFNWDKTCKGNTWSSVTRKILTEIGLVNVFETMLPVSIEYCKTKCKELQCNEWKSVVESKPKLRTYKTFKHQFETEPYVISFMNRKCRSFLAQYRSGILPIELETGRWINKPVENRLCKLCHTDRIEDEHHITFDCSLYNDLRLDFMTSIQNVIPNISGYEKSEQIHIFMSKPTVCLFAKYVCDIMTLRQEHLFA